MNNSAKPILTVAAVIQRDGKFLLVEERVRNRRVINQPAGRVEIGESLVNAAVREAMEETAWEFIPRGVVGVYRYASAAENKYYVRVCFHGEASRHHPDRELDSGIDRAVWLDRDELLANQLRWRSPLVIRCIDDYLAGRSFPLDLLVDLA